MPKASEGLERLFSASFGQGCDQFFNLPALDLGVARLDGVLHTVRDVILQDLCLDLASGSDHRLDLGDHVDAIAIILDHPDEAADLAFNALEAGSTGFSGFVLHG